MKDTTVFVVYLVFVNTLCNIIGIIVDIKRNVCSSNTNKEIKNMFVIFFKAGGLYFVTALDFVLQIVFFTTKAIFYYYFTINMITHGKTSSSSVLPQLSYTVNVHKIIFIEANSMLSFRWHKRITHQGDRKNCTAWLKI